MPKSGQRIDGNKSKFLLYIQFIMNNKVYIKQISPKTFIPRRLVDSTSIILYDTG